MSEIHIFDRYTEAALLTKNLKGRADLLVQKLRDDVAKLKSWTDLTFVGGTFNHSKGFNTGRQPFHWEEVPEIRQVAEAVIEYQVALKQLEDVADEMTDNQREVLHLTARRNDS